LFKSNFVAAKTRLTLTEAEILARKKWIEARETFTNGNASSLFNGVTLLFDSLEELLASAIVPPLFTLVAASTRSKHNEKRKHRHYPLKIGHWAAFAAIVETSVIAQIHANKKVFMNALTRSADLSKYVNNEQHEESFLHHCLWQPFIEAGLMCDINELAKGSPVVISAIIGLPDSVEYAGGSGKASGRMTAMIECKSSQDLLIPNEFLSLQNIYNTAANH
jgi:hypothetical protein